MTKNKIALITGGGGFLATQHVYALSQLNCKIILIDINKKKLINIKKNMEKKKISCEIFKADITKEKNIKDLNKVILKKFKRIDILINNASIDHIPNKKNQKFKNLKLKDWNKELEVGLTGDFLCSKIFGQAMQNRKEGIILNIASDLSITEIVSLGIGFEYLSIAVPPIIPSNNSKECPYFFSITFKIFTASCITSGPIPSPGNIAILQSI